MYDRILVPTDGSDAATEALDHALAVAEPHDATVHVLHVVDRRVFLAADAEEQEGLLDELHEEGEAAVAALAERVAEAGVEVETAVVEGVPYRTILKYGEDNGVDLVVMGTHGRTGREKRVNLGSVTERVVKSAERPVLVVDIGE